MTSAPGLPAWRRRRRTGAVPPPLPSTRRAVRRASRRVVRRWSALVLLGLWLVLGGLWVAVYELEVGRTWLLLVHAWLPMAGLGLRLAWPPRAAPGRMVVPTGADQELLGSWIGEWCAERPRIALSPECGIWRDGDTLVVGMPVLAGLDEAELEAMVRFVDLRHHEDLTWGGRLAMLLGRGAEPPHPVLARPLEQLADALADLDLELQLFEPGWAPVAMRHDVVAEAWSRVREEWLQPAVGLARWHAEPFTGLALRLDALELAGGVPRHCGRPGATEESGLRTHVLARFEPQVARLLAGPRPGAPLEWHDHPAEVSVPRWRLQAHDALAAAGLVAADALGGARVEGTSVDAFAEVDLQDRGDWRESVRSSSALAVLPEASPHLGTSISDPVGASLRAMACVALVDAEMAVATWEWPRGTVLRDHDDLEVFVPHHWTEPEEMRAWLAAYGVDTARPLALDGLRMPRPRLLLSTHAWVGGRRHRVEVSERTLRLSASGGTTAELPWSVVRRAELVPLLGGHHWRLRLHTVAGPLTLWGAGEGYAVEHALRGLLGTRLRLRWPSARPRARALRDLVGCAAGAVALAGMGLTAAGMIDPWASTTRADWVWIGLTSLGVLALGALPDLLASLREQAAPREPSARSRPLPAPRA